MKGLSLFSGCGGLDLGVHMVLPSLRPVAYVEKGPAQRAVLASRMNEDDQLLPEAPVLEDVVLVNPAARCFAKVEVVVGGFPCTDFSSMGKRMGFAGQESSLWKEMLRLAHDLPRARWLIAENVASIRKEGLEEVLDDLHGAGFDARWCVLPTPGGPHERRRWFLLARRRDAPLEDGSAAITAEPQEGEAWGEEWGFTDWGDRPRFVRHPHWGAEPGNPFLERLHMLGGAVVPRQAREALRWLLGAQRAETLAEMDAAWVAPRPPAESAHWPPMHGEMRGGEVVALGGPAAEPEPQRIVLMPRVRHDRSKPLHELSSGMLLSKRRLSGWATPRASAWGVVQALTERAAKSLTPQLIFAEDTPEPTRVAALRQELLVNPVWVEGLMGLPEGWTESWAGAEPPPCPEGAMLQAPTCRVWNSRGVVYRTPIKKRRKVEKVEEEEYKPPMSPEEQKRARAERAARRRL